MENFGPNDWIDNFRMRKETFYYLCNKLRPTIEREDTPFRQSISTKKRVAITLWCLATPCEYRTISHLFGVARSTVCSIVHETCHAIVTIMLKEYIKFPVGKALRDVAEGFENKWGFPQ